LTIARAFIKDKLTKNPYLAYQVFSRAVELAKDKAEINS
jgi:hypothetical protein